MSTIETKTAKTILEDDRKKVTIAGKEYTIAEPSTATILMASALISELPNLRKPGGEQADGTYIIQVVLDKAKGMRNIGKLLALLILGAKRVKEHRMIANEHTQSLTEPRKKGLWATINEWWRNKREKPREEIEVLTDEILDNLPPGKIYELLEPRLLDQDISGFFYLTTSLKLQANILEPTKTEKERQEEKEKRKSEVETS